MAPHSPEIGFSHGMEAHRILSNDDCLVLSHVQTDPCHVHIVHRDTRESGKCRLLIEQWGYSCSEHTHISSIEPLDDLTPRDSIILADVNSLEIDLVTFLGQSRAPVIALINYLPVAAVVRAIRSGASDVMEYPLEPAALRDAVNRAAQMSATCARLSRLSPREHDVLRLLIEGHYNKVIAHRLGISPRTVEIYRARIMEKAAVPNFAGLVALTLRTRWDVGSRRCETRRLGAQ